MYKNQEYIDLIPYVLCENSDAYWIPVEELEEIWKPDKLSYVQDWNGPPKSRWFKSTGDGRLVHYLPCAQILDKPTGPRLNFANGRHRCRWQIKSGQKEILLSIYKDVGVERAGAGLTLRKASGLDEFRVLGDFDVAAILNEVNQGGVRRTVKIR